MPRMITAPQVWGGEPQLPRKFAAKLCLSFTYIASNHQTDRNEQKGNLHCSKNTTVQVNN